MDKEYIEREATCRDCIHYPVCKDTWADENWNEDAPKEVKEMYSPKGCANFKSAADMVEVRHGEWLDNGERDSGGVPKPFAISCSVCGSSAGYSWMRYCPNCGANMVGGKKW